MSGLRDMAGHRPHGPGVNVHGAPVYRIPTVNEALPYSPFASIVPFDPGLIPPPLVAPQALPTAFENLTDVQKTREDLQRLSAGARKAEDASQRCRSLMRDVKELLNASNMTQFKFKRPVVKIPVTDTSSTSDSVPKPNLSNFGQMLYDSANIRFRCDTPEAEHKVNGRSLDQKPHFAGRTIKPEIPVVRASPQAAPVRQNVQLTPKAPIFVLPTTITPEQCAEYLRVNDDETVSSARMNGFQAPQHSNALVAARAVDPVQRTKGDAAVDALQTLLFAIFEAEDSMQQDTSGVESTRSQTFFASQDTESGSVSVLVPDQQTKLDHHVQKVRSAKRISDIEVGHLARVLQICENGILVGQLGSLTLGSDWEEQDVAEWLGRISRASSGLTAARTLTSIMVDSALVKELQSEDSVNNVMNALRTVTETCIIPLVEERPSAGEKTKGERDIPVSSRFAVASEQSKYLQNLMQAARKTLRALGDLLVRMTLDESALSSLEYLCKLLIFAENATTEKESALGLQSFETLRKTGMDVLCQIYTKYPEQRDFILQEILMSLEKLPATKQSARQFRLIDAKPIQLVSALLMRLVQTSASSSKKTPKAHHAQADEQDERVDSDSEESDDEDAEYDEDEDESGNIVLGSATKVRKGIGRPSETRLASAVEPLQQSVKHAANYIIGMLLQRALATTKSSEEPFRKLLDIFTDDFLNVFTSSDWPSAEVLLRTLATHLIGLAENPKSPAPSRTLALELLGVIGSGILDTQAAAREAGRSLENDGAISENLIDLSAREGHDSSVTTALTAIDGPYRVLIEYIQARGETDAQLQSACGYHLMQWAQLLLRDEQGSTATQHIQNLQDSVLRMLSDAQSLDEMPYLETPSTAQGKLAAKIVASRSLLSRAFNRIFNVILASMNSEQPTIRSRSLKSVYALLEKDPSVLDRNAQVLNQVFRSLGDSSSLVRDSALSLIEKCVSLRPQLQLKVYDKVVSRTQDTAIGVRKRAIKFLKLVYLNNDEIHVRTVIAGAIVLRLRDHESSVIEIARDTVEEVWFAPFRQSVSSSERNVDVLTKLRSHASLLIQMINADEDLEAVLEPLLRSMLVQTKQATENARVCKMLVNVLFDGIIDSAGIPGNPDQGAILHALTVFAKASPSLFTASQIERLEPYTKNLTTSDDLDVYHYATTVLHYTMPCLTTSLGLKFLENLQTALLLSVNIIPKSELEVVAPCLWEIDKALKNTERLVNFVGSAAAGVHNLRDQVLSESPQLTKRIVKLLAITGQFGKACNFQPQLPAFKTRFDWYRGNSVAGLLIDIICRFTSPKQPLQVRESAIEAVCAICQTWPEHFLRVDVINAMETVFRDQSPSLEHILLTSLEIFFAAQEAPIEDASTVQLGSGVESGSQRLGGTYKATEDDKASTAISQRFLVQFLRLALSSFDDTAMSAARIVVSINRQGRAHPRESGPGLVALETCPNQAIAKMAFVEHKNQYAKHESVYEKELIRGIQQAFEYQREVAHDTLGYTGNPATSKLHLFWEVLKSGKAKVRTKFFTNLCAKMDFDPSKLNLQKGVQVKHLPFVRFCLEAIAFFEYDRIEELAHLLSTLEKTFAGTGTAVAQAVESEVLKLHVPVAVSTEIAVLELEPPAPVTAILPERLRELAVSAQILSLFWETRSFLRRFWNMQKHLAKQKSAAAGKESNRAPTRASNGAALTEAYMARMKEIMNGATDEFAQHAMCRGFIELISVDSEVRVGEQEDGDEELENGFGGRSEGSLSKSPTPGPRGKKRKSISGASVAGPRKKGKPKRSGSFGTVDDDEDDEEWI